MSGRALCLAAGILCVFSSGGVSAEPEAVKPRLAVLGIMNQGADLSDAELDVLTDDIREQAVDALRRWFTVMTRENLLVLLDASDIDMARCVTGQCEVQVGRNVQAAVVVSGAVSKAGGNLILRLSAHQTDSGSVLKTASAEGRTFAALRSEMGPVVRRVLTEVARTAAPGSEGSTAVIGTTPEAWQPGAAEFSVVAFESRPRGAVVLVNGRLLCQTTPCSRSVEAGSQTVTMQLERHLDRVETLSFQSGQARVSWDLTPDFGWISVTSTPPGLPVTIDGKAAGTTPLRRVEASLGAHEVLVSHPQYYEVGRRVEITRGAEEAVVVEPTPRLGAVRVEAVDGRGDSIPADVSMDGAALGRAPGQWPALVGAHSLVVKSSAGVWKGNVDVREKEVSVVRAETVGAFAGQCITPDGTRGGAMCFVPAGAFVAGCRAGGPVTCVKGEEAHHKSHTEAYWIDQFEITVADYRACMRDGTCDAPATGEACNFGRAGRDEHPVNCIGHAQAARYCSWAGKRLPAEDEWEKAARGTDGRLYPWGNEHPSCSRSVMKSGKPGCGKESTWKVGQLKAGASPFGLLDMGGNVWEWVGSAQPALRGGSWVDDPGLMRASLRLQDVPTRGFANTGARCARADR